MKSLFIQQIKEDQNRDPASRAGKAARLMAGDATAGAPGDQAAPGTPGTGENICRHCNGTGEHDGAPCPVCDGTGKIIEGIGGG